MPVIHAPLVRRHHPPLRRALNSAMSQPAWLEKGERFSLSGGFGFSETTIDNTIRVPAFGLTCGSPLT